MNGKRLLTILGSPHPAGITASMLRCAAEAAQAAGWEVEQVNLYEKKIAFCSGCRACIRTGRCIQEDDAQELAALLRDCDAVILAAPAYWANVPAVVKNLFDRLLGVAMEETGTFPKPRLPGRTYYLLTACNTPFPFSWLCGQSRGALRAMDEFFKTAGMTCGGRFVCTGAARRHTVPDALKRKLRRCWK